MREGEGGDTTTYGRHKKKGIWVKRATHEGSKGEGGEAATQGRRKGKRSRERRVRVRVDKAERGERRQSVSRSSPQWASEVWIYMERQGIQTQDLECIRSGNMRMKNT